LASPARTLGAVANSTFKTARLPPGDLVDPLSASWRPKSMSCLEKQIDFVSDFDYSLVLIYMIYTRAGSKAGEIR
jgi:hypothetical protein